MNIEVLRIGQRIVRDDRVTTHVALVARALGASKIYMNEVDPEIEDTVEQINETWGGNFEIEFFSNWKDVCLLYTSPSPRDGLLSRMPSSA